MCSLYTRRGDEGYADACTGDRTPKDDAVFDALGTVDELQCVIGVARCHLRSAELDPATSGKLQEALESLQKDLSQSVCVSLLPSLFSTPGKADALCSALKKATERVEATIDECHTSPLHEFVLPGASGCLAAAQLQVCRAVCRRAERAIVHLLHGEGQVAVKIPPALRKEVLSFMNRCSDMLFAIALFVDKH